MNVCLVSQDYPPDTARGGISTQTWNKARGLARLGHRVHVVARAGSQSDRQIIDADNVTVHRIEAPGTHAPIYEPATFWVAYTVAVQRALAALISENHYDVVDFAEYGAEGFAYQLDRGPWNWVPVVVQLHAPLALLAERLGWPAPTSDLFKVGTWMEGYSIAHADALMSCSGGIADFAARYYQVPREAIDVVYCGVDAETFRPPAKDDEQKGPPYVLFVGNLASGKGLLTALDAVVALRHKYPTLKLKVAGHPQRDMLAQITERATRASADCVEILGYVGRDALPRYYQHAVAFCSPAVYEGGVANVYLEAMACGCPVVASVAGGATEVIDDAEQGFLVSPEDPRSVAEALDRLLADRALRRRMGDAARYRVEQGFAMDTYLSRILRVYERAIDVGREKLAHTTSNQ